VEREIDGTTWRILGPDDPLLREAEAWIDQSRCRFYPEVWQVGGIDTPVPNLRFALTLARSWVARGRLADDPRSAAADHRRAIRLGRLLRQDDVTLIQDLIGIACIRMGAEALYEQARSRGDAATMAAIAIVLGDHGAMRHRTAERVTTVKRLYSALRLGAGGEPVLDAPDADVLAALELVQRAPERRFVLEGLFGVQLVHQLGRPEHRAQAETLLDELASRDDALVAHRAAEVRAAPLDRAALAAMVEAMSH
jgi:hypothetical protein